MSSKVETIQKILTETLSPTFIEVLDDSQAHAGHQGSQSGAGHFYLTIASDQFEGKTRIQRHQLVYKQLGDMMKAEIHALSIKAFTPKEHN